jgi:hypothetical protein
MRCPSQIPSQLAGVSMANQQPTTTPAATAPSLPHAHMSGFQKGDIGRIDRRLLQKEILSDKDGVVVTDSGWWTNDEQRQEVRQCTLTKFNSKNEALKNLEETKLQFATITQIFKDQANDPENYEVINRSLANEGEIICDFTSRFLKNDGPTIGLSICAAALVYRDIFIIVWYGSEPRFNFDLRKEYTDAISKGKPLIDLRFPHSLHESALSSNPTAEQ